jgi:membrane associated rhomboid family serine protease
LKPQAHNHADRWAKGRAKNPPFCFFDIRRPLADAAATAYLDETQILPVTHTLPVTQRSEPIFNVPPVVIATIAVLVLVHAVRMLALTPAQDDQFLLLFAFIAARYDAIASFPGGFGAALWTFFTYGFIHASLIHIGLNLAWLLPFGTAVARRFGAWRYVAFMLVTSAAGALAYLLSHPPEPMAPMIGASAAISGAMAAAMRFAFQQGGPLFGDSDAYRVPARSLYATLTDLRFLMFVAVWFGLNALFALGTVSMGVGDGEQIAWQAHIGGFLAGLVLFNIFDPVVPQPQPDPEPGSSESGG